jgi:hypothetical protein
MQMRSENDPIPQPDGYSSDDDPGGEQRDA